MPAPYRRLGRIVRTHGTQGEVVVAPRGGLSLSRATEEDVWVVPPPPSGATARRISEVRPMAKGQLLRVSGVDSLSQSREIVGSYIIARGEEPAAEEDAELFVGLCVEDERRGRIGIVREVIETGANDVLVVEGGPFGQVLVPVIPDVIIEIGDESVRVRLLDGLIDEDDS
jgi:16S rRNA processing protein RimM